VLQYERKFVAYFYFVGWGALSTGVSVDLSLPNLEIHVPFGFFRLGWIKRAVGDDVVYIGLDYCNRRTYGWRA
jgi:hypothetical protein